MKKRKQIVIVTMLLISLTTAAILAVNFSTPTLAETSEYMKAPQITVLTHGIGGSATHWSSQDGLGKIFAQDDDSLVHKLSQKAGGAYIYRAETTSDDGNNPNYTLYENYGSKTTNINSVSKPIIIIFESEKNSNKSNNIVYSEFKYMLNDVINSVKRLNPNQKKPKVNLIGHSRGGITNLQYTLEFPQNVDSMISIGTPFFGSEAAASFGGLIGTPKDALADIVNEELYNSYYRTWKDGYKTKYKNINSVAIGGISEVNYLRKVLKEDNNKYSAPLSSLLLCYLNETSADSSILGLIALYPVLTNMYPDLKMFSQSEFSSLLLLINQEVSYGTWYSDVLVPINSQQGIKDDKNYYFRKFVKKFNDANASLHPKRADDEMPIIHNLEPYDADIHDYILNNIVMKDGDLIDNELSNVGGTIPLKNSDIEEVDSWTIKIKNIHNEARDYVYNSKTCFKGDAENWTGLKHIKTLRLEAGETQIVEIKVNGTAMCIAVSSINGNRREIRYADNLSCNKYVFRMTCYSSVRNFFDYAEKNMKVSLVGKYSSTWLIKLTNNSDVTRTFDYNQRMCNESDAKNWKGLSHIATVTLAGRQSAQLEITEYGTATSIAISYVKDNIRNIFYANKLDTDTTMTCSSSTKTVYSYTQEGMNVGIIGKNGSTWILEFINETGSPRTFEYNQKMCFEGDAREWKGLSHVAITDLIPNGTTTKLEIQEYGTATSIAISYEEDGIRHIFYAKNLNSTAGTMTDMGNTKPVNEDSSCIAAGTLITLADGSQKSVEDLTGDEMLLVWNMQTGTFDAAPILFIDKDELREYEVINLYFSDGSVVKVISEHAFWDLTLNEYVYLDKDAADYIGHWFSKQDTKNNGNIVNRKTKLIDVVIEREITTAWSPVTYGHLCYYVNGMLSVPGGITGLINILEIDPKTMTIDKDALLADIETYGLFTYEEFAEILPIPEKIYEAINGQYLKIAIGKGLTDFERLEELAQRYSKFF